MLVPVINPEEYPRMEPLPRFPGTITRDFTTFTMGPDGPDCDTDHSTDIGFWMVWLRLAHEHATASVASRESAVAARRQGDAPAVQAAIWREFLHGVQATTTAAYSREALCKPLEARGAVDEETSARRQKKRPWASRRVIETVLLVSSIPNEHMTRLRPAIETLFNNRNAAVHPDLDFKGSVRHHAVGVDLNPVYVWCRAEQADAAFWIALEFIALAVKHIVDGPHAGHLLRLVREGLVEFLREHPDLAADGNPPELAALLDADPEK